jgi:hypothetical protein
VAPVAPLPLPPPAFAPTYGKRFLDVITEHIFPKILFADTEAVQSIPS